MKPSHEHDALVDVSDDDGDEHTLQRDRSGERVHVGLVELPDVDRDMDLIQGDEQRAAVGGGCGCHPSLL